MTERSEICAVLAAYNRRETTLSALRAFFDQSGPFELTAVLMDDGSTDGTSEAVAEVFPQVQLLRGDGSLFWNGGMTVAYNRALQGGSDYYLWLNDDTTLFPDAVERLVKDAESLAHPKGQIIVGSAKDPESGEFTYGGVRSTSSWHPGKFELVPPGDTLIECDSMNGNVVLISATAASEVKGIDGFFSHSMGDYDYALRARKQGVAVRIGRGYHGTCARNPPGMAWFEKKGVCARLKAVNGPKGLPMNEWARFLKRHGNAAWPLAWLSTYRRILTG